MANVGERMLPPFHGENRGSIPLGRANHIKRLWQRPTRQDRLVRKFVFDRKGTYCWAEVKTIKLPSIAE
jgi:hypothetical protein